MDHRAEGMRPRARSSTSTDQFLQPGTATRTRMDWSEDAPSPSNRETHNPWKSEYPPIVAESLPNWTVHFRILAQLLGYTPNARPYRTGIRFTPQSYEESRIVQRYLAEASQTDPDIKWHCFTPVHQRPHKVAIRGLPVSTPPQEIREALEDLGFSVQHLRPIPPAPGRAGCLFFAQLSHLPSQEITRLYNVTELLFMPGVVIEAWRRTKDHKPAVGVRCGEAHMARDCPRPPTELLTCANCGGPHLTNDLRCPAYRKAVRRQESHVPKRVSTSPASNLAETPEQEGQVVQADEQVGTRRRRRRGHRRNRRDAKPPAAEATPADTPMDTPSYTPTDRDTPMETPIPTTSPLNAPSAL